MTDSPDLFFQRLSQKVIILLAALTLPALVASGLRALRLDGAYGVFLFQAVMYAWIVYMALPLNRTSFAARIYSLVGIGVAVGVVSLIRNPDPRAGMAFLIVACVFLGTVYFRPTRYIFIAIVFAAAAFISQLIWQHNLQELIGSTISMAGLAAVANMLVTGVVAQAKKRLEEEVKLRQERDEALAELAREQARRDLVAGAADIAYLEYDYATGMLDGDLALQRRFGRNADDGALDLSSRFDDFPAESLALIQQKIGEMRQQPAGAEETFVHQQSIGDGRSVSTFRVTGVNIEREGRLLFMGASIDISSEMMALERSELQAQQLDLLAQSGAVAYFDVDLERGLIDGNALLKHRAGLPADAPAFSMAEIVSSIPVEARAEFESNVQRAIEAGLGGVTTFEHPYFKADGELIYVRVTATTVMRQGRLHALGASVEITEAELAKQQAQRQADQLKLITEQGKIGLYEFDLEKGVMYANSVLCERHGVDPDIEVITQQQLLDSLTEDSRVTALAHIEAGKTASEGYFSTSTVEEVLSDGSARKIRIFEKLERRDGRPFFVGASVDVTEEVLAKEQAESAATRLAQEQDRQAQMYAVIGHELRTPAASLQMMLDDLGEGESLNSALARANIEQLLSVIDTLRAVAQPERMAQATYDDVQLYEMLQQQVHSFESLAASQGIEIKTDFTALTIHPVHIQKTLLRQVLSNLIKNALIHSGGTELEVGASGRLLEGERKALRLWIADNGKGVSADKVEKLFEAFVRGSTEAEGTGLGLHICREIIQNMGGDLRYEPRPEGGACFVIELEVDLAKTDPSKQLKTQANESPLKGMQVLLAEDNKTIQMLTQKMLEKHGAQLAVCNNGKEALEAFEPGKFDLVLSDIFMPQMNGYEFARQVRRVDSKVPLIGLTAATIGKETDEMLAAGASAVLSKPITLSKLSAKFAELVALSNPV